MGLDLKATVLTMPHFFRLKERLCPSSQGKILCFKTLSMENWRLLMCICPNASMAHDLPMMHSMRLLKFHPYIYGGESLKSMKFPMDSSSVTQSFFSPIVISSLTLRL